MKTAHAYICSFPGLDCKPLGPGVKVRCEASWPGAIKNRPSGQCTKRATHGVRYAWGAVCYCEQHAKEECG